MSSRPEPRASGAPRPAPPALARPASRHRLRERGGVRTAPLLLAGLAAVLVIAAIAWFRHVPPSGDARAAMAAGRYARAALWLERAASAGDPAARTSLGNLYYLGLGVAADARRAAELYHAAASAGHAPAQLNLGNLYRQGIGVAPDALRAFGWYLQADIHGSPVAENYLYQISVEYTLSPLQQSTAAAKWRRLDALVAEGL